MFGVQQNTKFVVTTKMMKSISTLCKILVHNAKHQNEAQLDSCQRQSVSAEWSTTCTCVNHAATM